MTRLFLGIGASLCQLTDLATIHQLTVVLRLKAGDSVVLVQAGREYRAKLGACSKTALALEGLCEIFDPRQRRELACPLRLFMPFLKSDKTEWVLQKCTELGVSSFHFLELRRSVRQAGEFERKRARWERIILEAVEQSERLACPSIGGVIAFADLKNLNGDKFVFLERSEEALDLTVLSPPRETNLLFGPEGGFAPEEREALLGMGFRGVSLGERVLRSETAIVVGVGLFSCKAEPREPA